MKGFSAVKLLDAALAAVALASSVWLLHAIDQSGAIDRVRLFSPPMLSSAIIFFAGPRPPPIAAFAGATAGAFVVGVLLHQLGMVVGSTSAAAQGAAAGLLLFYFKVSGSFFVPTVGLAAYLAYTDGEWSFWSPFSFLLAPWATGHLALYGMATAVAEARQHVRVSLLSGSLRAKIMNGNRFDAPQKLRDVFDRYDTDASGFLDPTELKLAMRTVTGDDLTINDCARIVRALDCDGNGVIDFHEFGLAISEHAFSAGADSSEAGSRV